MGDNTKKTVLKSTEILKVEIPTEEQLKKAIAEARLNDLKGKSDSKKYKGDNLTGKGTEETSKDLDAAKADVVLSQSEKKLGSNTLQDVYNKAGEKIPPTDDDKKEGEKSFIDKAKEAGTWIKDKAVDNWQWIVGGITAWGVWKWFKGSEKKEGEKEEGMSRRKKAALRAAGGLGIKLARDNWGKDALVQRKYKKMLEASIAAICGGISVFTFGAGDIGPKLKEFLTKNVLDKHSDELMKIDDEGVVSGRFWELAKDEMKLAAKENPWMSPIISGRDKVMGIVGVDTKATVETEAEAQQKVDDAGARTDAVHDAITNNKVNFNQKEHGEVFTKKLVEINKLWSEYSIDFEKNKSKLVDIYTQYIILLGDATFIKANNGGLAYPNITTSIITHLLEATKYMKKNKEYMAATNGIRQILLAGGINTEAMPTSEEVLADMNDRQKLIKSLESSPDVDKWMANLYKTQDYQDKYNTSFIKRQEKISIDIKNISDEDLQKGAISKVLSETKDVADDMFGHGIFTINDMFFDKYRGTTAGVIGGTAGILIGTVLDVGGLVTGGTTTVAGVALQAASISLISTALTAGLTIAGGQEYDLKEGAGDLILNAVPGGAIAKFGKTAVIANRASKALAIGMDIGLYGGAGVLASKVKTGERNFGQNIGVSLAMAVLPIGLSKLAKNKNIKLPKFISDFNLNIANKFENSSNVLVQNFRKQQLLSILRNEKVMPEAIKNQIKNDAKLLSQNIYTDIQSYIAKLESEGNQAAAAELKQYLAEAGISLDTKAISAINKASKKLAPNVEKLNGQIANMTQQEVTEFNKKMNSLRKNTMSEFGEHRNGSIEYKGENYILQIDNGQFVFKNGKGSIIDSMSNEYNHIFNKFETGVQKKIVNIVKTYAEKNDQSLYDWMQKNGYQIKKGADQKVISFLQKNKISAIIRNIELLLDNKITRSEFGKDLISAPLNPINGPKSWIPFVSSWITRIGLSSGAMTIGSIVSGDGILDKIQNGMMNIVLSSFGPWAQIVGNAIDYADPLTFSYKKE